MSESVARRYARALFELAQEANSLREASSGLRSFADAYEASADFRALQLQPGISETQRVAIIKNIGTRLGAPSLVTRSVALLAERRRLSVLVDMARIVDELVDEQLGILRIEVTAAAQLSTDYKNRLKKKIEGLTGKHVTMAVSRDESLIAGVVTKIGDRVIDGSVRGKLDRLAESLRRA